MSGQDPLCGNSIVAAVASLDRHRASHRGMDAGQIEETNTVILDNYDTYQRTRGFSELTIKRRRSTLTRFCRFILPKPLDRAALGDVEEFLAMFRAPRTRHAYKSDLSSFFRWAVTRDLLPTNPVAQVDPVKIPRALPRPIGPEVQTALLTGSRRVRQMVGLGLYAGLRCAEIAALDVSDIADWSDPPNLVVRAGKGGRDRVVPMHPVLVELLRARPKAGPLFPNRQGRPVLAASVSQSIRRHLRQCGIDATPHRLRHSFATEMTRRARGDVFTVATVMGHSSVNDTMRYAGWAGAGAEIVAAMFPGDAA